MYPQRDQRDDKTHRAERAYIRVSALAKDFGEFTSGSHFFPRPDKWINGRVKIIVDDDQTGSASFWLIDQGGIRVLAKVINWTITTPGVMEKFIFDTSTGWFAIDGETSVIEIDSTHSAMRLEYNPLNRQ